MEKKFRGAEMEEIDFLISWSFQNLWKVMVMVKVEHCCPHAYEKRSLSQVFSRFPLLRVESRWWFLLPLSNATCLLFLLVFFCVLFFLSLFSLLWFLYFHSFIFDALSSLISTTLHLLSIRSTHCLLWNPSLCFISHLLIISLSLIYNPSFLLVHRFHRFTLIFNPYHYFCSYGQYRGFLNLSVSCISF